MKDLLVQQMVILEMIGAILEQAAPGLFALQ
jgi:hypothetical protein